LYLQQEIGEVATLLGRAVLLKPDFISPLLFLSVYLISGNIGLAAGIIVAAGLVQLTGIKLTGRELAPMRWTRFVLIAVLAGASILTQNPRFVMMQPSVVAFTAAILMLRRGGMFRYIAPIAGQSVPESVTLAVGYAWAALLVALGLTNLIIALYFGLAAWAWFVLISAIGTKALRYAVFCTIVRSRLGQLQANP
jgi:intracellular septation protein A